jgi:hypothetical protein
VYPPEKSLFAATPEVGKSVGTPSRCRHIGSLLRKKFGRKSIAHDDVVGRLRDGLEKLRKVACKMLTIAVHRNDVRVATLASMAETMAKCCPFAQILGMM